MQIRPMPLGAAATLSAIAATTTLSLGQVTLAFQGFEGNSTTGGLSPLVLGLSTAEVNAAFGVSAAGTVFDSGSGLAWNVSFVDTRGVAGPIMNDLDTDLIGVYDGVTAAVGSASPDALIAGSPTRSGNVFYAEDTDGRVVLTFASVMLQGLLTYELDFVMAVADTGFEDDDAFGVTVNGATVLELTGDALTPPEGIAFGDFFSPGPINLTGFAGEAVEIAFFFDTSTSSEDLAIDNVVIRGTPIPASGALALLAAGAVLLAPRRRR